MQKARRKLIKGALAATVVSAAGCGGGGGEGGGFGSGGGLGSGNPSAFSVPSQGRAVMSWHLCIEKSVRDAEATQVQTLTQFDDTFLRGTLPVANRLVPTASSGGEPLVGQFFLDASQRWRQIVNDGTSSTLTQWTQLTAVGEDVHDLQVLLAIDDYGNIIQTRLEGPEGRVATDSCWNSVITRAGTKIA